MIKLFRKSDGKPIWLNVLHIKSILVDPSGVTCVIANVAFEVKETPDSVAIKINNLLYWIHKGEEV